MDDKPKLQQPPFEVALKAWQTLLEQRGLPTECLWIFDENLCFERDAASPAGFRVGFQTAFTPPPPDAEHIAYDYFVEFEVRLVFYRLGTSLGKSVCLVLCDEWFESRSEADGYVRQDGGWMSFRPGGKEEVAEVTDKTRWEKRLLRDRPLHDLDFCMTLQSVHELMAHGRVLSAYERYALRFLHAWKRLLGT